MTHQLLSDAKIVPAILPTAGAIAAFTASEVDGRGYDRAMFVFSLGTAAAGGTFDAKLTDDVATGMATAADYAGAALAQVLKAAGDGKIEIIDVPIKAARPFMLLAGSVGTGAWPNSAICILYRGSKMNPPTQVAVQKIIL
jgi:nitrogen regulatory protein PII